MEGAKSQGRLLAFTARDPICKKGKAELHRKEDTSLPGEKIDEQGAPLRCEVDDTQPTQVSN